MQFITPTRREFAPVAFFVVTQPDQAKATVTLVLAGFGFTAELDFTRARKRTARKIAEVMPFVTVGLFIEFVVIKILVPKLLGWR